MFGSLRLLLAILVALNHVGLVIQKRHPAVFAVVVFNILSGYIMTWLIERYFTGAGQFFQYCRDRLLRIYPLYAFFCIIALGLVLSGGVRSVYVSDTISLRNLSYNATIIPLNYFMINGVDRFTLLPPTWSLGADLQFYLLIPFVLAWGIRLHALAISLAIFTLAITNHIDMDSFGYRLLPGTLFMFLSGSLLHDIRHTQNAAASRRVLGATYAIVLTGAIWATATGLRQLPYMLEVCLGYLIGVPAVRALSCLHRTRLDDALGHLSYGVFLCHFIVIWAAQRFHLFDPGASYALYLLACAALAYMGSQCVERPLVAFRKSFRHETVPPASPS
jgi:peptidoglycan/LPS O-acetylase OafA/YrhL